MTPIRLFIALAVAALVAACGVKSAPDIAGDQVDMFPRTYPDRAVPPEGTPPGIFHPPRYPDR